MSEESVIEQKESVLGAAIGKDRKRVTLHKPSRDMCSVNIYHPASNKHNLLSAVCRRC